MTAPQSSPPISNNTPGKKFSISIKKEYRNLLPLIPETDFESLKASIKAGGLDVPVIVNKGGIILDGHHRGARHFGDSK